MSAAPEAQPDYKSLTRHLPEPKFVDRSAPAGETAAYEVIAVNGVSLASPPASSK